MEDTTIYSPNTDQRIMAILSHILAILPAGGGILGPLIIYLVKKDEPGFVYENAKESLNFQLTVIIFYIAAFVLLLLFIGLFLFWIIGIANVILVIVATAKASEGKVYRYPFNLRLIKQ